MSRHDRLTVTRSSGACAGRFKSRRPPEKVVDQRVCGCLEFGEPFLHVAALKVRPENPSGNMHGHAERRHLKFHHYLSELLDAARAAGVAIAHETARLAVPLRIDSVDRILEHR